MPCRRLKAEITSRPAHLQRRVRRLVRHREVGVRAVLLEFVLLGHLRGELPGPHHGLIDVTLIPVFHADVEVAPVAGAGDGGQYWGQRSA